MMVRSAVLSREDETTRPFGVINATFFSSDQNV